MAAATTSSSPIANATRPSRRRRGRAATVASIVAVLMRAQGYGHFARARYPAQPGHRFACRADEPGGPAR